MLTREGFVAADMSVHTALQRSSWKAEAIRRGDLKISGPIPMTEQVPLNEDEEREFVQNNASANAEQPRDALGGKPQQRPVTPPQPLQVWSARPEQPSALRSNPVEDQKQLRTNDPAIRPTTSSPMMRVGDNGQRESVLQSPSNPSPTPYRSTPESARKAAQKTKRKSGLRNVFRKMFGRKGREEMEEVTEETTYRGHSYHQSDPGMLRQSPTREGRTPVGPRISELPVEDLKPLHPIGQQLPFPMNVNAPQASPPLEYLHFDRPRRATLPSIPVAPSHRHSMDESHGRLSAWQERTDDDDDDVLPSPKIGIALSSPTQATPSRHKRRSRSADALFNLSKDRESIDRGQSTELRHWRASYMSGSIYSRPQTAKTVETIRSVQAQEPVILERGSDSIAEMSATLVPADEPETPEAPEQQEGMYNEARTSVSAFNFGNLHDLPMAEKQEQAEFAAATSPPLQTQEQQSIEDRVQHLEDTYENLEGSIRRMSTRNNRQTIILENAPKNLRTRNRSTSRSASASRSRSTTLSIHQEPVHSSSGDAWNTGANSPVLTQSILGGKRDELTDKEKLRMMHEALRHERTAREALEQQVRRLQHDMSDLQVLVNKLIVSTTTTSPSYPTPSPDTLIMSSNEERLITPRAERYDRSHGDVRESLLSRFSRSETGSESEYDEQSLKQSISYDDAQTPDIWATPKEEGFKGEFFHTSEEKKAYA